MIDDIPVEFDEICSNCGATSENTTIYNVVGTRYESYVPIHKPYLCKECPLNI